MDNIKIQCDECKHIFDVELVEITEKNVQVKGIGFKVAFFQCPECNKIYVCHINDEKLEKLILDCMDCENKIEKAMKNMNYALAQVHSSTLQVKKQRLEKRKVVLMTKYLKDVVDELNKQTKKGELRWLQKNMIM